jgi:hypothetical protein
LRTFPLSQWFLAALRPHAFVGFTVTGIARKFHPIPMTFSIPEERRASLRRYTGYSFVIYDYKRISVRSQSVSQTFGLLLAPPFDTMIIKGGDE